MSTQIVRRKRGDLVRLQIELDASQSKHLTEVSERLCKPKSKVIAEALNIWFSMVEGVK